MGRSGWSGVFLDSLVPRTDRSDDLDDPRCGLDDASFSFRAGPDLGNAGKPRFHPGPSGPSLCALFTPRYQQSDRHRPCSGSVRPAGPTHSSGIYQREESNVALVCSLYRLCENGKPEVEQISLAFPKELLEELMAENTSIHSDLKRANGRT